MLPPVPNASLRHRDPVGGGAVQGTARQRPFLRLSAEKLTSLFLLSRRASGSLLGSETELKQRHDITAGTAPRQRRRAQL